MSDYKYPKVIDRRNNFTKVWAELAPEDSFAGMTLAQFTASTEISVTVRDGIQTARTQLAALLQQRDLADEELRKKLSLVINSVRGNPQYGEYSPLYRALGYVPKNARQSGLLRSKAEAPAANAGIA